MYQIRHAFSELERNLIRERTKAGMEAARQRGAHLGRPEKLSHLQIAQMQGLLQHHRDLTPLKWRINSASPPARFTAHCQNLPRLWMDRQVMPDNRNKTFYYRT